MSNYKYGWKPQRPDFRDLKFEVDHPAKLTSVSLFDTTNTPPVYDQGQLGSCTGNGIAAIVEHYMMNKSATPNPSASLYAPSRLFIYYYERALEGTVDQDSGANIRDGIKVVASKGVPTENMWPYDITKFADVPPQHAIDEAKNFEAIKYYSIDNARKDLLVGALHQGLPVVFGFTVYESFESQTVANTGIVPMPSRNEQIVGGHCTVLWGYNADHDYFIVRNSWGKDWGLNGYFHMPAAYVTNRNLSSDYWVIQALSSPA